MSIFGDIKRQQISVMLEASRAAVRELEAIQGLASKGCSTCANFARGHCDRHGTVPIEFQPHGCDDWLHDHIPF